LRKSSASKNNPRQVETLMSTDEARFTISEADGKDKEPNHPNLNKDTLGPNCIKRFEASDKSESKLFGIETGNSSLAELFSSKGALNSGKSTKTKLCLIVPSQMTQN